MHLGADEPVEAGQLMPVRMLNEFTYCLRLFYLEWVQGEFVDNEFTVEGRVAHRRVDARAGAMPPPAEKAPFSAAGFADSSTRRRCWRSSKRRRQRPERGFRGVSPMSERTGSSVESARCARGARTVYLQAMSLLNPTAPDRMVDADGRPYFLWDVDMTLDQFRTGLRDPDPEVRAYLVAKLMRQAKPDDVFLFVRLADIIELWPRLERFLGRSVPMWRWLIERWREEGHGRG